MRPARRDYERPAGHFEPWRKLPQSKIECLVKMFDMEPSLNLGHLISWFAVSGRREIAAGSSCLNRSKRIWEGFFVRIPLKPARNGYDLWHTSLVRQAVRGARLR